MLQDENGVDDGWWEGEVNGSIGVFPSLVVEEITDGTDANVSIVLHSILLISSDNSALCESNLSHMEKKQIISGPRIVLNRTWHY